MNWTHKHGDRPCRILWAFKSGPLVVIEFEPTAAELVTFEFDHLPRKVLWSIVARSELTPL